MSTRTGRGSLRINDTFTPTRTLTVIPHYATITFLVADQDTDQRAEIHLGTEELDQLAAEILRIRAERDF